MRGPRWIKRSTIDGSKGPFKKLAKRCEARATGKDWYARVRRMDDGALELTKIENKKGMSTISSDEGAIVVDVAKHIARESLGAAEADGTSRKIGNVGDAK